MTRTLRSSGRPGRLSVHLLLITVFVFVAVEFTGALALRWTEGRWLSPGDARLARAEILAEGADPEAFVAQGVPSPFEVDMHPYYGFGRPDAFSFLETEAVGAPAAATGSGGAGKLVVGVTGGSVAYGMYRSAREALEEAIATELWGDQDGQRVEIEVVLLGWFAWKQPQQAMALQYYLTMGGQVDVVVNLDGRNEISDVRNNARQGVHHSYPWLWFHLASNVVEPERLRAAGRVAMLREERRAAARSAQRWARGWFLNAVWLLRDRAVASRLGEALVTFDETSAGVDERPFGRFGPQGPAGSAQDAVRASVEVWKHASRTMHDLMTGRGGRYFHFLQPNQYVKDSKPLSPEELRVAYREGAPVRVVEFGYPLLQQAGGELLEAGVSFHDLTGIFRDHEQTLYRDRCCHLNSEGSRIMALEIGRIVAQDVRVRRLAGAVESD